MSVDELIWLATVVIAKNMDYETFKYSDYMYGQEELIDNVWFFVDECQKIGSIAFKAQYPECKLAVGF